MKASEQKQTSAVRLGGSHCAGWVFSHNMTLVVLEMPEVRAKCASCEMLFPLSF